jgi:hypothetical protein
MEQMFLEEIENYENKRKEFQDKLSNHIPKDSIEDTKYEYLKANYHYNDGIVMGLKLAMNIIKEE